MSQAAQLSQTSGFFKNNEFLGKVLPQAAQLLQTGGFLKEKNDSWKSSAPGSAAAPDKWLVQKKRRISGLGKVLPQAAQLPRTSGFFNKISRISPTKICPKQLGCPGEVASSRKNVGFQQVARSRKRAQPLRPRAWSSFWGVRGTPSPGKQGRAGGRSPPRKIFTPANWHLRRPTGTYAGQGGPWAGPGGPTSSCSGSAGAVF